VGDDKYGDFELNKALQKRGFKRMFLHAWHLQCVHPATQNIHIFKAELPTDLALSWKLANDDLVD
jgi:23S rRNA pseudouridine955/2504/2580 synthase